MGARSRKGVRVTAAYFRPLSFGGWADYRKWADHDFQPCPHRSDDFADVVVRDDPPESAAMCAAVAEDPDTAELEPVVFVQAGPAARPYVRSHGRVRCHYDLRLETILSTPLWTYENPRPRLPGSSDLGRICALCEVPQSVAEISAHLNAPLGVTRILLSDALDAGLILLHHNQGAGDGPSMELLTRVHRGLLEL